MENISSSPENTRGIGKNLANKLKGGDIVLLSGELGSGKTTLVKGMAEGLGIEDDITSPTFTLMNVYKIKNSELRIQIFVHVDTYRLEDEKELIDIGIEDYLGDPKTICVIEWPEKLKTLLQNKKTFDIMLSHEGDEGRKIIVKK